MQTGMTAKDYAYSRLNTIFNQKCNVFRASITTSCPKSAAKIKKIKELRKAMLDAAQALAPETNLDRVEDALYDVFSNSEQRTMRNVNKYDQTVYNDGVENFRLELIAAQDIVMLADESALKTVVVDFMKLSIPTPAATA